MEPPASSSLRVALLQMVSHGTDIEANARKGEDFCRRAKNQGADIALFPEMWSIGYSKYRQGDESGRGEWLKLAVPKDGPFVQRFRHLARELGMAIAITYLELHAGLPRDSVTLIGPDGAEIFTYAKVHTCSWDSPEESLTGGNEFCVGDVPTHDHTAKVGVTICFDREFPESARMLMVKGAEVILTPNACELDVTEAGLGNIRVAQFRTRAFENAVGVAMVNYENTWDEAYGHRAGTHSPRAYQGMVRSRSACEVRGVEVILLSPKHPCGFRIQPLKPKTGYLCSAKPQL